MPMVKSNILTQYLLGKAVGGVVTLMLFVTINKLYALSLSLCFPPIIQVAGLPIIAPAVGNEQIQWIKNPSRFVYKKVGASIARAVPYPQLASPPSGIYATNTNTNTKIIVVLRFDITLLKVNKTIFRFATQNNGSTGLNFSLTKESTFLNRHDKSL